VSRQLTTEQNAAIDRLFDYDHTILVAGTGVGKTVIALTAIWDLIQSGTLRKVIVAAPAKVIEKMIWLNEMAKWEHLRGMRAIQLEGDSAQRIKTLLSSEAEIILVSLNNLDWLLNQDHDCDGIVVDELSKAAGKWTKGLKSKKLGGGLYWRVGMTATPVSQSYEKIFSMARIIDGGRALGTNKQKFMQEYFYPSYSGHTWTLKGFAAAQITDKVRALVYLVDDNKVEVLPTLRQTVIEFDMPPETREIYNDMKKHMVVEGREAANQAVKSGVLRQIASGFYYADDGGTPVSLDNARIIEVGRWVYNLDGEPGLIFFEFVEQGHALRKVFGNKMPHIVFAQVQAMSHGVDGLQHEFADVLFMQPVWSRDTNEQAIGRVWRQGQEKPVTVTTLVCRGTLDELVMQRVEDRGRWMELFTAHLKGE
jgi:hypothetical protein